MLYALAILALGLLVIIHEAGHFFVARACGMKVETFSVGFGPKLLTFQGKKTEYTLSLVPLGGYVRIAGMAPGDGTPEDSPESFVNKPAWQRFLVLLAGPAINYVFAFALLTVLFMIGFQVATKEPLVGQVLDGTAAASAGILPQDRVLAIDGSPVNTWAEMTAGIQAHKSRPMELKLSRNGAELNLTATPSAEGRLGIAPATTMERYAFSEAAPLALFKTGQVVKETIENVAMLFRGKGEAQIMGPVGIVSQTVAAARLNGLAFFAIIVQISLALAVMNLLPIPALDGGRLLFITLAMIRRKPVNARVEAVVHGVGVLVLLGLMAYATFGDIGRSLKRGSEPQNAPTTQQQTAPAKP